MEASVIAAGGAGATDRETITLSSSEFHSKNTREGDIIEAILAILESCGTTASSSHSPRGDKETIEAIKQINNHTHLLRTTKVFEWWNNEQATGV